MLRDRKVLVTGGTGAIGAALCRTVAPDERLAARRWAHRFELPMIMLAIWMLIEWYLREKNIYSPVFALVTDWFIWLFFSLKRWSLPAWWMTSFAICVATG